MMDTVLNLGLNDETVAGLAAASGDARFAWDSYRRFIQMYADVVLGLDHDLFEEALEIAKEDKGVHLDTELDAGGLAAARPRATRSWSRRSWAGPSRRTRTSSSGARSARCSAPGSGDRAKTYRRLNDIPGRLGHRGQRPGDGVRQYGRDLGHRRRLHPRSLDRRARLIMANI